MDRLRRVIPAPRMRPYVDACAGTPTDPVTLYRWNAQLSLALFDDLGTVEVAMRSAMADSLSHKYGLHWYRNTALLDDESLNLVQKAWSQGRLGSLSVGPDVIHGKLVATLMFGFWVKILGRGGYQGTGNARQRRIYDTLLWKPALHNAFPQVHVTERARVERAARNVQVIRNRIAHHEHIWGVPLPGQLTAQGTPSRIPVRDAHATVLELAGYLDSDLRDWLNETSQVPPVLAACPLPQGNPLNI